ncbi:MAG: hypothetical protein HYX24_05860 [Candidatus Aenigmarchaeota archaeon]|nr:hypothetical protein [Candidatus Aenigmarchaeota archaeon]
MADLFSLPMILFYAILYGITMKSADLLDEHGYKWFRGSAILFGVLWGIFGSLLIVSDIHVGNVVLAQVLALIIRMRIDYRNHAIAAVIIIISFLLVGNLEQPTFFAFFLTFLAFGSVKDYFGDKVKRKDLVGKIFEFMWYYPLSGLVYGIYTNQWLVFYVFALYTVSYGAIKYWKEK